MTPDLHHNKTVDSTAPILALEGIGKRFAQLETSQPLEILCAITLTVHRGDSLAIIGPSGSGKSTLLNLIGTLDRPTTGSITFDGQALGPMNDMQLAAIRNEKIGFVFQSHHLLPQCTVMENVLVPTLAGNHQTQRADAPERALSLLKRLGLGERTSHRPGQLSGGERQRVAVARALINQPRLLLADEPTGALDRASAHDMARLLVELNREDGVTLIVVTHALDLARQMKTVLELRDGTLRAPAS